MKKMFPNEVVDILRKGESNILVAQLSKEIEELKKQFEDTDYKTTKNLQYEKMGIELPYSWDEIYKNAEEVRNQIREKEKELENIMGLTDEKVEENIVD